MIVKKKVNFGYLQSTAELIRRYCLPQQKLHVLNICRKEERSFVRSFSMDSKIILCYYCKTCLWQSLKLFSSFITFLKWEIHPYFDNFFTVSGRLLEGILMSTPPKIFDSLFDI